jgi:hypothetical protein
MLVCAPRSPGGNHTEKQAVYLWVEKAEPTNVGSELPYSEPTFAVSDSRLSLHSVADDARGRPNTHAFCMKAKGQRACIGIPSSEAGGADMVAE